MESPTATSARQGIDQSTQHLVDAVQRLSLARSLDEIRAIVRTAARALTGADGATFVLRDGGFCHYVDEDAISPLWKGLRFPLNTCISGWAMTNRSPVGIVDISIDERIPQDAYAPTFVKSLAMVPIRSLDPVGAIGNYWATSHEPTEREMALLGALADSTAVAMENVRAFTELEDRVTERTASIQALHDEVTEQAVRMTASAERNLELLRTLAHEVRGPLAAADGMLELALDAADVPRQVVRDMELAKGSVQEGMRIVTEQLDLARLQAGVVRIRPEPVEIPELLRGLHGMCEALRRSDHVAIRFDPPPPDAALVADRHLLGQILRNLLTNALKFTDAGHVSLSVAVSDRGDFEFVVADTGIGMTPAELERAFDEFGQVDAAQHGRGAGTGLGLPLVRRLSSAMGGDVIARSTAGVGSSFTLTLPPLFPPRD